MISAPGPLFIAIDDGRINQARPERNAERAAQSSEQLEKQRRHPEPPRALARSRERVVVLAQAVA